MVNKIAEVRFMGKHLQFNGVEWRLSDCCKHVKSWPLYYSTVYTLQSQIINPDVKVKRSLLPAYVTSLHSRLEISSGQIGQKSITLDIQAPPVISTRGQSAERWVEAMKRSNTQWCSVRCLDNIWLESVFRWMSQFQLYLNVRGSKFHFI